VVECTRRQSQRFGVVVDFKIYRLNGKRYPIMQTETSRYFVDPETIMIVERLEPFAKKTDKSRKRRPEERYRLLG
jgi:murein endopeptidase